MDRKWQRDFEALKKEAGFDHAMDAEAAAALQKVSAGFMALALMASTYALLETGRTFEEFMAETLKSQPDMRDALKFAYILAFLSMPEELTQQTPAKPGAPARNYGRVGKR